VCCPNLARTPGGWLGDLSSIADSSIRAWAIRAPGIARIVVFGDPGLVTRFGFPPVP
jgi:hypothetical protein